MWNTLLATVFTVVFTSTSFAIPLKIHCPYPHGKTLYKNSYVYVDSTTLSGVLLHKQTNASGIIHLPKKFINQTARIYLTFPKKPNIAIPGCSTVPLKITEGLNIINFKGSGSTMDCGIVSPICAPE